LPLPFVVLALVVVDLRRWLATQIASTLLLVFVLMGFVLPRAHAAKRDAPVERVLSYNINSGHGGLPAVLAQIDAYSPDTVLLQEVGHVDELERLLRSRYPTVQIHEQFAMASRHPLLSTSEPERIPYYGKQRSSRFLQYVMDTELGRIVFYNVHPVSPREGLHAVRGLRREILSGHLLSSAAAPIVQDNAGLRGLQVEAFSRAAAGETDPVVLAGDTNLPDLSRIYARNLSAYQDGFRQAGWGFGYTFPNDRHPWMRIDRILATAPLRFVGFEVGDSAASDHRCVVAEIQRPEP
jgi:vancomycin resistance protein VanJ